jgi:hypothetical protein
MLWSRRLSTAHAPISPRTATRAEPAPVVLRTVDPKLAPLDQRREFSQIAKRCAVERCAALSTIAIGAQLFMGHLDVQKAPAIR